MLCSTARTGVQRSVATECLGRISRAHCLVWKRALWFDPVVMEEEETIHSRAFHCTPFKIMSSVRAGITRPLAETETETEIHRNPAEIPPPWSFFTGVAAKCIEMTDASKAVMTPVGRVS